MRCMTPHTGFDLRALHDLAVATAREAGSLQLERFHFERTIDTKSSPSDAVTEVDRACEELIVARIRAARPEDAIIGEEGANLVGRSGVAWVIDPLDGTVNYVYRRAEFSVSIGVEVDGVASVGAVYDPTRDEMFSGIRGHGAWLNGEAIETSPVTDLGMSLTGTGFGYDPVVRRQQGRLLASLLPRVRDIRRGGSAALELCGVACGRLDAYFERGVNHWDVAGAVVIVREAGGVVEPLDAPEVPHRTWVAAGTPALFDRLRTAVVEASGEG
jgi:myo-inositol-1(or 4)-monophosphatase